MPMSIGCDALRFFSARMLALRVCERTTYKHQNTHHTYAHMLLLRVTLSRTRDLDNNSSLNTQQLAEPLLGAQSRIDVCCCVAVAVLSTSCVGSRGVVWCVVVCGACVSMLMRADCHCHERAVSHGDVTSTAWHRCRPAQHMTHDTITRPRCHIYVASTVLCVSTHVRIPCS